ncbi:uncharacterized protein HKW66_Vig0003470 [Vigna angularis]|uniref:Uncharacterized protein n=1 Tax=Phaseolus angularis TaxID=3914 RepID=A0A8T0LDL3_PHAAN|nr:uncharacterized protein HKW66_Vig0003470 [Vigna angularis]
MTTFLPPRKRKEQHLYPCPFHRPSWTKRPISSTTLMDEDTHIFYRLLKTKRSTFLPSRKRKVSKRWNSAGKCSGEQSTTALPINDGKSLKLQNLFTQLLVGWTISKWWNNAGKCSGEQSTTTLLMNGGKSLKLQNLFTRLSVA